MCLEYNYLLVRDREVSWLEKEPPELVVAAAAAVVVVVVVVVAGPNQQSEEFLFSRYLMATTIVIGTGRDLK